MPANKNIEEQLGLEYRQHWECKQNIANRTKQLYQVGLVEKQYQYQGITPSIFRLVTFNSLQTQ